MPTPPLPELATGPRLTVRRWTPLDAERLDDAVRTSLDHLRPWMPWAVDEPLTLDERRALLERWEVDWKAGGDLVVGMLVDGVVVGGGGLHHRVGPGALEIGYWVHVDHTGRGYATEAVTVLTDLAFTVPGIERIEIHHDIENEASAAVPRRLGFESLGQFPDEVLAPAERGVECRWATTREAWAQRAAAPGT